MKSSATTKKVFVHLAKNDGGAREYVEKAGMVQISDPVVLIPIIHQAFAQELAKLKEDKKIISRLGTISEFSSLEIFQYVSLLCAYDI